MVSPIYIKFGNNESLLTRKELLECQVSLINLMQRISNYREMRKDELKKKEKLRVVIKRTHLEINSILNKMPKIEGKPIVQREMEAAEEAVKRRDLQERLVFIKKQLSDLRV